MRTSIKGTTIRRQRSARTRREFARRKSDSVFGSRTLLFTPENRRCVRTHTALLAPHTVLAQLLQTRLAQLRHRLRRLRDAERVMLNALTITQRTAHIHGQVGIIGSIGHL